jgi:tRNA A22 N-methylase
MLITRTINTVSTRLTAPIEAVDKAENKTTIHIEAVEGEYTKEINNIKETKEQDFCRRDTISAIN